MNFSKQLKKYRELNNFSQEKLAGKIYVTRQTISKWENDKSYPDIHNLLALSVLFDTSLDELIKGDVEVMKKTIANKEMDKDVKLMILFMGLMLCVGVPSIIILGWKGYIPFTILSILGMYYALKIEKMKKKFNVKTYKEIIAFAEGNPNLEKLQSQRSQKKYFIEKCVIVLSFTVLACILAIIVSLITSFFMGIL